MAIFQRAIFLRGNCPEGGRGGGNFPWCNRPDTVDNTLSIHFGEVQLINKLSKLNITYDNYRVKQFHIVEQPGCWWIHGDEIS